MPQANLTAQLLGLGGATADSFNRLSINAPAMLFNNAGAGIEATVTETDIRDGRWDNAAVELWRVN